MHPFDRKHGTETGALIPGERLQTGHRSDRYVTAYLGTQPSLFGKLLKQWQELALHPMRRTAFIDVGAGKGRAMMLAAELPFRRIIGVELHPQLAATARANLQRWLHARPECGTAARLRLIENDVLQLRMPAGPCCLYLYNPFDFVMMDRFLDRLARLFAGRAGELDLLYVNDEQREVIAEEHGRFRQLWRGRVWLSREDRDADKATIRHCADGQYVTAGYEDCSIYRLG